MLKLDTVFDYMELYNQAPVGASRYAPLIIMINNDKRIVKELWDKDFNHYNNLWSFLDYGLNAIIPKDYSITNDQLIEYIILVLNTFNNLDNKFSITGDEFIKILKEEV